MARVLIVDDDGPNSVLFQKLLDRHGHETRVANHPHDAIQLARQFAPHVVFTDILLPDMDGYELARILKTDADISPRVIAVSGYADAEEDKRDWLDGYLVKPVRFDELLDLIHTNTPPS